MKVKENLRLFIWQTLAAFFGILTLVFAAIPAYFEEGKADLSLIQIAFGVEDRVQTNGVLILGLILLILGVLAAIGLTVILVLKSVDQKMEKILTIGGIVAGLFILAGAIILACGLFISGITAENSTLGFTQGNWGIRAGNILEPIFGLLAFICCYPTACVILHRQDEEYLAKHPKKAKAQ